MFATVRKRVNALWPCIWGVLQNRSLLEDRRNTFASFSEGDSQLSWQAQHFGRVVLPVLADHIVRAASSGDNLQIVRQAWDITRVLFSWQAQWDTLHTPRFKLHTLHYTNPTPYPARYIPHSTLHCLHTPHSALHPSPDSAVYTSRVTGEECTRLLKYIVLQTCSMCLHSGSMIALAFVPSSALQSILIFFTRQKMSLM